MESYGYIIIAIVVIFVVRALIRKKPKPKEEEDDVPERPVSSFSEIQKAFRMMSDFSENPPPRAEMRSTDTEKPPMDAGIVPRSEPPGVRAVYDPKASFRHIHACGRHALARRKKPDQFLYGRQ